MKEKKNTKVTTLVFFGILIVILILLVIILKLMPVTQYDKPITHSTYYTKQISNMRVEPNTKSEIVKKIPVDTEIYGEYLFSTNDDKWFVIYEWEVDTLYNYLEINGKELFDSTSAVIVGYIYASLLDEYTTAERQEIKERDAEFDKLVAKRARENREKYAGLLRTRFLDNGLNIKVKVYGDFSDVLDLTYIFMSEVMIHHIKKNFDFEFKSMGFVILYFRDGYGEVWSVEYR